MMKSFLVVFRQQIVAGRMMVVAALLLGIIAWFLPFLPHSSRTDPAEVRGLVTSLSSVLLVIFVIMIGGAGLFSRDLVEGRLSFFFARPISAGSLWCGRLLGVVTLTIVAVVVLWLPTLFSGTTPGGTFRYFIEWPEKIRIFDPPAFWNVEPTITTSSNAWIDIQVAHLGSFWLWLCVPAVLLLLLVHLAFVALRVRSGWIVLDTGALIVGIGLFYFVAMRLSAVGAWGALLRDWWIALLSLLIVAFAAGLAQLVAGRSDPRRCHAVGSTVFGLGFIAVALLLSLDTARLINAAAGDIGDRSRTVTAPGGDVRVVAGLVDDRSGYAPVIVVDDHRGIETRLGVLAGIPNVPNFSADGRLLAWRSCPLRFLAPWRLQGRPCNVMWLDLDGDAKPRDVGTQYYQTREPALALESLGKRLAFLDGRNVVVLEMPEAKVLHVLPLEVNVFDLAYRRRAGDVTGPEVLHVGAYVFDAETAAPTVQRFVLDEAVGALILRSKRSDLKSEDFEHLMSTFP